MNFHDTATIMENLTLWCMEDDGGTNHTGPVSNSTEEEEFECPELTSLVIDGRNYYKACRRDSRWTNYIDTISSLTVSHFKPRLGESFTTHEFL